MHGIACIAQLPRDSLVVGARFYFAAGADKSAYLTMMMARTTMIGGAAGALSKAR